MRTLRGLGWRLLVYLLLAVVLLNSASTEVKYVCYSQGDTTLRLQCPADARLLIEEARFGGSHWRACAFLASTGSQAADVGGSGACSQLGNEGMDCCGRTTCNMPTGPVYMPACGYNSDFLRIVYQCVTGANLTCGPVPLDDPPSVNHARTGNVAVADGAAESASGKMTPRDPDTRLVLQDFRRLQEERQNRERSRKKIFGYRADTVISFFCVGGFIILVLLALLIYVCKRPDGNPKNSSDGEQAHRDTDSRKEELMETMFFDEESFSASSRSGSHSVPIEAPVQLNGAFAIETETMPKQPLNTQEPCHESNNFVYNIRPPETGCSPSPSARSTSSGTSLPGPDDDSGVETSHGSSEHRSQNSPTLSQSRLHEAVADNIQENNTIQAEVIVEHPPDASNSNPPSICRVLLDSDHDDVVDC